MGCVPHSVLLQFICRAPSVNKCPLSANVDAPLEERRGWPNFGRVPARKEASDANGGNCGGRIRQFMAPHSGAYSWPQHSHVPGHSNVVMWLMATPRRETC